MKLQIFINTNVIIKHAFCVYSAKGAVYNDMSVLSIILFIHIHLHIIR